MNSPYVTFVDSTGSASMSLAPLPAFPMWTPNAEYKKETGVSLGTGLTHTAIFRTDYTADITLPLIKQHAITLSIALRLMTHMGRGGQLHIVTYDTQANVFDVVLQPGKSVTLDYDSKNMEYSLKIPCKNTVASPLVVIY